MAKTVVQVMLDTSDEGAAAYYQGIALEHNPYNGDRDCRGLYWRYGWLQKRRVKNYG